MPRQNSDAWLLLAIIYAGEPADRDRILRVWDGINHALFTEAELAGGLARLLQAGYVVEVKGCFAPSPAVQEWFFQASPPRSRIPQDLERVERYLGVPQQR